MSHGANGLPTASFVLTVAVLLVLFLVFSDAIEVVPTKATTPNPHNATHFPNRLQRTTTFSFDLLFVRQFQPPAAYASPLLSAAAGHGKTFLAKSSLHECGQHFFDAATDSSDYANPVFSQYVFQ